MAKNGRYGPYVTEPLPRGRPKKAKPRTGALFASMDLDTITLDQAVELLKLPRVVGRDREDGTEVTAQNGATGPTSRRGTDSRSLEREDQLLTITLEEEVRAIYAQPKSTVAALPRRRSRSSATTRSAARRSWPRTAASACT